MADAGRPGQEGGPFFDFNRTKSGFAPDVQLGYMVRLPGDWLAGSNYLQIRKHRLEAEREHSQNGTGTFLSGPLAGSTGPLTGSCRSAQRNNLKHQLSLIGTIGRASQRPVICGRGPALFGVETNSSMGYPSPFCQGLFLRCSRQRSDHFVEQQLVWGARRMAACILRRAVLGCKLHLCAVC